MRRYSLVSKWIAQSANKQIMSSTKRVGRTTFISTGKKVMNKLFMLVGLVLISGCQLTSQPSKERGGPDLKIHYIEIVSASVDEQRRALEQLHGLSFSSEIEELGGARVSETSDGYMIGIRAPLAEHELPIIRTYFEVSDISMSVETAEASGAVIAYPPTKQGDTGTWAIYILDGIQYGLWQK